MKLEWGSVKILCEIDRYIRQADIRGEFLCTAASDVTDGAYFRHEVGELIRKRLLCVIRDGCGGGSNGDPGDQYTLHLTERAMSHFWGDRRGVIA